MLLSEPPPETIDHAPVVAPPPMAEPLKAYADGLDDWHTLSGPPAFTVGNGFTFTVLVPVAAEQPAGALLVNNKLAVPVKLAAGVYVTEAGLEVPEVLLNVPPPEVIDHAPVVAPPPILEPVKAYAVGLDDWQTLSGPAGVTVGGVLVVKVPSVVVKLPFVLVKVARYCRPFIDELVGFMVKVESVALTPGVVLTL